MRTIETKIYTFDELSEEAKEKAIEYFQATEDFDFVGQDAMATIRKGLEAFGNGLSNWSIDYTSSARSSFSIESVDSQIEELTGQRLRTWLLNNHYENFFEPKPYGKYEKRANGKWRNDRYSKILKTATCCPFTGVCYDESFMDVFREFVKNPCNYTTFEDLLKSAVETVLSDLEKECEYLISEEAIIERIEGGDYEFTENGELA